MKNNLKIIGVLTGITCLCGFLLALVFTSAQGKILENQKDAVYRAITGIVKETSSIEEADYDGQRVYVLKNSGGTLLGYAYLTQGQGYQSTIGILFAVDKGIHTLLGIEIIESVETPGLGSKITEESFKEQFRNVALRAPFEVVKEPPDQPSQIRAITSATVSSKAVVSIVNAGISQLKELLQ